MSPPGSRQTSTSARSLPVVGGTAPGVYGPARETPLTRAMRQNLQCLGTGRPQSAERPVTEESFAAEVRKKGRKEVREQELDADSFQNLPAAKAKEWKKMLGSGSVRVHVGDAARALVSEVGERRLLKSRFAMTRDDEQKKTHQLKARWVIRGYRQRQRCPLKGSRLPCTC